MEISFKKSLLSVVAGCALLLSACGGGQEDSAGKEKSEDKKVLQVGTEATFAPFEFMDKGKVSGFDVDLLNATAEEAGYEVNIENTGWDAMFAGLQSKQLDIGMAGVTINDERKKSYDFSVPYFESTSMIAFKEGTKIKGAEDLKGKKVGVQNGTTGQFAAEAVVGKNSSSISKYETAALMFQALQSGDVETAVTDIAVALEYVKNNPDSGIKTVGDDKQFKPEYYGIVFPKGSKYKEDFDKALNELYDNGKYTEIYKKWFGKEPNVETLKEAAKQ
ncbi:basic amino acid ABC transporter substrate-binding protein [Pseudobacillus wudalianchiensis]|uniref:Glutamine ABC transporter substrate-binding protein n=1 Tax=Pseudobacillus wudalianchiensis TaxID=1743143 RepID=A0A1B9ATC0_9BACI|nr:basic amino acid ABC transporter substrate-binding protein [Bacillus wudalianchiensis]OCA87140.1 glutamine ABC transporter substrate-binding protein [Bacillus wudalianchiensis]